MKKAFITGITGQDGSYLAELLLAKGYEVFAIMRRSSVFTTQRIEHLLGNQNLHIVFGDLTDSSNLHRLLKSIKPHEIYNLAAQSHVAVSFEVPEYTADTNALGVIRILDAIRDVGLDTKFYQASTSELFGGFPSTVPQNELTPFYPRSPYSVAKLYAYWIVVNYRESYGLFAVNGILFNHESPRRGETFVTKKITKGVASISKGLQDCLILGNLNARRDWGHAKDYVKAQWLMLQQKNPSDYVISTGESITVREFVEMAFGIVGIKIEWKGEGINEVGININNGRILVMINDKYFRPSEVEFLQGDSSKALRELGWQRDYSLADMIKEMVEFDLNSLK